MITPPFGTANPKSPTTCDALMSQTERAGPITKSDEIVHSYVGEWSLPQITLDVKKVPQICIQTTEAGHSALMSATGELIHKHNVSSGLERAFQQNSTPPPMTKSELGNLFARYSKFVFCVSRRLSGSSTMAEEVTQDVFLHLWSNPSIFDAQRGSYQALLGTMAHYRTIDMLRSNERRVIRDRRDHQASSPVVGCDEVADSAVQYDTASRVRRAIGGLPNELRAVIDLAYFGGLTYREVASYLRIPEGTAKSRLRMALRRLAIVLEPEL